MTANTEIKSAFEAAMRKELGDAADFTEDGELADYRDERIDTAFKAWKLATAAQPVSQPVGAAVADNAPIKDAIRTAYMQGYDDGKEDGKNNSGCSRYNPTRIDWKLTQSVVAALASQPAKPADVGGVVAVPHERLQNWIDVIHDNERSLGDRLQCLSVSFGGLLHGEAVDKYPLRPIREQQQDTEQQREMRRQESEEAARLQTLLVDRFNEFRQPYPEGLMGWARAALAAQTAAPGAKVDVLSAQTLNALMAVATAAYEALDNSEERAAADGGEDAEYILQGAQFEALSAAMDQIDALPDDKPGYTLSGGARAQWALRGLLSPSPQPVDGAAGVKPEGFKLRTSQGPLFCEQEPSVDRDLWVALYTAAPAPAAPVDLSDGADSCTVGCLRRDI